MKTNDLKESNWLKGALVVFLLVSAYSIFYYSVVRPEKARIDAQLEQNIRRGGLTSCLAGVDSQIEGEVFDYCVTNGYQRCERKLPLGGTLLQKYISDRDACFKQYPQN